MALPNRPGKRGLAAIVGSVAAAGLLLFTPAQEGRVLKTYRDIGGIISYCDGATESPQEGHAYTNAECDAQTDRDLERHAAGIAKCVNMERLTDGQKIAFVDAAYNVGVANFCSSSMARKANAGDMVGACNALLLWNRVGNREVLGLTKRRQRERELCLKGLI
jgi:lysozyme